MKTLRRIAIGVLVIITVLSAAGCAARRVSNQPPAPVVQPAVTPPPAQPVQPPAVQPAAPAVTPQPATRPAATSPDLSIIGTVDALKAALAETSAVRYDIQVVADTQGKTVSDAFEDLLAKSGNPSADTLLLVIFPKANYDIRFAMGGIFNKQQVSVDEMLGLIRSDYLPEARRQDPATGLAKLIQKINKRVVAQR